MEKIVVIGGGSTGIAFAGDLHLAGFPVTLLEQPEHAGRLEDLKQAGEIRRVGYGPTKVSPLPVISLDPGVLSDASIIFIAVVANRHRALCDWIVPYLSNGQAVCFFNGNCGSLLLKHRAADRQILAGETVGNYCSVRYLGKGRVWYASHPAYPKGICAFPTIDSQALSKRLSVCYPTVCPPEAPVQNVLEAALGSPNVAAHLICSICCLSAMEHSDDFRLYRDGVSPALIKLVQKVQAQRDRVLDAFGYKAGDVAGIVEQCRGGAPSLEGLRITTGPDSIRHRYIIEDAFAGNSLLISMGKLVGIDLPLIRAAVEIASALNDTDYYSEGVTLENLGLDGLSVEQLNSYLTSGKKTSK
ncbi:NAD/NADP octopine/nopaline dehydrogenase family protein [Anaerotruncus rubiinfantis]|uniref:NAD/NADP octopine/nopaline dehydrogenase family protein n=1 Tax=Anaerotruncus rubiinfantis TaxID=1720200 RepID=UPI0034A1541B